MNTKALLTGTLLTALFTATTAFADGDMDQFFYLNDNVVNEAVEIQKASLQTQEVKIDYTSISGRK